LDALPLLCLIPEEHAGDERDIDNQQLNYTGVGL
jgi:hypothetical protein